MKKIIAAILSLSLLLGTGCSFFPFGNNQSDGGENKESLPLYQIEDVVRSDLLWDTKTLFDCKVTTKEENVDLGENIEAFKFQSAPYGNLQNTWVFAAIGMPETEKPKDGYPAIVLIHGGGGTVSPNWMKYWMERGFVTLAFDVFGHQLDENLNRVDNPESGPKENYVGSNKDSVDKPYDSWVYHVVYNAIMSNNILRSNANVDKNRIVAMGVSWGGYATCVVSGVDKRFAAFTTLNGCGYLYRDTKWLPGGEFGGADKETWIALYDPSSYLPYATKPMLFVSGLKDEYFSTYNRIQSASLIKGKAFYSQRRHLDHANWPNAGEIYEFFQHVLYKEPSITLEAKIAVEENIATLQYENKTFKSVYFVYTTSKDADSHKWVWESVEVEAVNGTYSCEIPADATAYLFEMQTTSFLSQSTNVTIVESDTPYC